MSSQNMKPEKSISVKGKFPTAFLSFFALMNKFISLFWVYVEMVILSMTIFTGPIRSTFHSLPKVRCTIKLANIFRIITTVFILIMSLFYKIIKQN